MLGVRAGSNGNDTASYTARLNQDGTTDASFTAVGLGATPIDIALTPDGKIIIVGGRVNDSGAYVMRLNQNGSLDTRTA